MSDSSTGRDCPCKRLPLSLSSFTAAEYGDLHSLISREQRTSTGTLSSSSSQASAHTTPLHLAAQHGHVTATAWLLQQHRKHSGGDQWPSVHFAPGGATPLHRASFSGAVATMRLLLEHASTSTLSTSNDDVSKVLLARDTSFGDQMTPLHKATAGGRYLAVQLLLDYASQQQQERPGLLAQVLQAKDSQGRTPRQVAVEMRQRADQERKSVARWDEVAGGPADWEKCLQLLRSAESRALYGNTSTSTTAGKSDQRRVSSSLERGLPAHLTAASTSALGNCLDCTSPDGQCMTASWEQAFRASLQGTVESNLSLSSSSSPPSRTTATPTLLFELPIPDTTNDSPPPAVAAVVAKTNSGANRNENSSSSSILVHQQDGNSSSGAFPPQAPDAAPLGDTCATCRQPSITLYRRGEDLVCRKCR